MPLDPQHGETLEGFDTPYVVIAPRHLAEMTNLEIEYPVQRKLRTVMQRRQVFEDALDHGAEAFLKAGALPPITFDESCVVVQAYPKKRTVAVVMMRKIAGQERFCTRTYKLPQAVIRTLVERAGKKFAEH